MLIIFLLECCIVIITRTVYVKVCVFVVTVDKNVSAVTVSTF